MNRIAKRINDRMDLCGFSAAAQPDMLVVLAIYSPFFAPALA